MADEHFSTCAACGATIYPEHLGKKIAGEWEGQLLCHHCLAEKQAAQGASGGDPDAAPISLADAAGPTRKPGSQIRAFGGGPSGMSDSMAGAMLEHEFKRALLTNSSNATRCRSFHAKLTDAALAYLNDQINSWVDEREDVEIKFATSTIGVVEGKHADPHLIITVFY